MILYFLIINLHISSFSSIFDKQALKSITLTNKAKYCLLVIFSALSKFKILPLWSYLMIKRIFWKWEFSSASFFWSFIEKHSKNKFISLEDEPEINSKGCLKSFSFFNSITWRNFSKISSFCFLSIINLIILL